MIDDATCPQEQEDRKFLHDLATPMTVARSFAQIAANALAKGAPTAEESAAIAVRLGKVADAIEKMILLHAEQKARLHERHHGHKQNENKRKTA